MTKWADMTEEQKERRRATHRRDYERHRAARLEYQRQYRLNMTEEQKEKERQYQRDMRVKARYARENVRPSVTDTRERDAFLAMGVLKDIKDWPSKKHGENVK